MVKGNARVERLQYVFVFLQRISVQRASEEFKTVETHFCKTMKGFDIVKIERIQNKALWEVFQWYVLSSAVHRLQ